jgi:hypothetical protein
MSGEEASQRAQAGSGAATGLELRIATGIHAGARIVLEAPVDPAASVSLSIGPGLDHDVVLSDAPGSAQLQWSNGAWRWGERDFDAELTPGGSWRWGLLQLTLSEPDRAWDAPVRLLFDRSRQEGEAATAAGAGAAHAEPGDPPTAAARSDEAQGASHPPSAGDPTALDTDHAAWGQAPGGDSRLDATARSRRWQRFGLAAAVLIVCFGLIILVSGGQRAPDQPAPAQQAAGASAQGRPVDLAAIRQALDQAGLANRVRVIPLADGRVRLSGVVLDDEEIDRMITSVRRVTGRIVQGVLTQPEFARRVADLQTEIPQPVRMRPAPVGRLLLVDAEREGIDLPALRDWLGRALPEALEVLVVERAKLAEIEAPPAPRPQAEPPAAPPPPVVAIPALPELPPDEPPFPTLPEIRLVIGGANPYVVLGSGEKWLPGGRVGGWFLAGIEARAIILEDVRGRRVSNPR